MKPTMRIALLEDDPAQSELMHATVQAMGYHCECFSRGRELMRALGRESFDMLVIDWQLPDIAGPDVVMWVREFVKDRVPILMVTHRGDDADIVRGLGFGADDYMIKPLRVSEFVARARALLRRSYPVGDKGNLRTYGQYVFNEIECVVSVGGRELHLKRKEYDLARILFSNAGRLLSRKHLIEAVWGLDSSTRSRSLDTHIARLRLKLALRPHNGFNLQSVYGIGYRLECVADAMSDELPTEADADSDTGACARQVQRKLA